MQRSESRAIYAKLDELDYEFLLEDVNSRNMQLRHWLKAAIALMRKTHKGANASKR